MDRAPLLMMVAAVAILMACQDESAAVPVRPLRYQENLQARLEIIDELGNLILSDKQIAAYEWQTHKIVLQPGAELRVPATERQSIVHGIPFTVNVNGVRCYEGKFTTSDSSFSQSCVVIDVAPIFNVEEGCIRIQLGYPGKKFFKGEDPRGNERIRSALKSLGKLRE